MSGEVVPTQQGFQNRLQVCVNAPRHDLGLGEGPSIFCHQVGGVVHSQALVSTGDDLVLVNAGLQKLHRGRRVLSQAELMDPHPQAVPSVETEADI